MFKIFKRRGKLPYVDTHKPTALDQDMVHNFAPKFVEKLNQYNKAHENYALRFYYGPGRIGGDYPRMSIYNGCCVFAVAEDVPDDLVKELLADPDDPRFETYMKQVDYIEDVYINGYRTRRDDPDVFARIVPRWFASRIDEFAFKQGLGTRFAKNRLHKVGGMDVWRNYGDPIGVRRDIFGQELEPIISRRDDVDDDEDD